MYIDIGFQDFIIEWLQDYGMIVYPVCVLAAIYGYTHLMRKKATSAQFGFGQLAESGGHDGVLKREAANKTMVQEAFDDSDDSDDSEDFDDYEDNHEQDETEDEAEEGQVKASFDNPFDDDDETDGEFERDQDYAFDDEGDDSNDDEEGYCDDVQDEYDEEEIYGDYLDDAARKRQEAMRAKQSETKKSQPASTDALVVMYLVPSESKFFLGYELLQALAHNHVHLSEKKHFQRFEQEHGAGQLWYHVASMAHPGTFDMSEPGKISCPGLVFIMETNRVDDPHAAFNCMVDTCQSLADDLGGRVLDSEQRPFNDNSARRVRYTIAKNKVRETSGV